MEEFKADGPNHHFVGPMDLKHRMLGHRVVVRGRRFNYVGILKGYDQFGGIVLDHATLVMDHNDKIATEHFGVGQVVLDCGDVTWAENEPWTKSV